MNIFKRYRLGKSPVFELNKNRQYLIGIDHRYFTLNDASILARELKLMGIPNAIAVFNGDPNGALKIIKSNAKPVDAKGRGASDTVGRMSSLSNASTPEALVKERKK